MALPSIEEILLAQAYENSQNQPNEAAAIALGSGIGALGGYQAMAPAQSVANAPGNAINMLKDAVASRKGLSRQGLTNRPSRGFKKAGSLVGMLVGGTLMGGLTRELLKASPEARLLAKIQTTGEVSPEDRVLLQQFVEDYYRNLG